MAFFDDRDNFSSYIEANQPFIQAMKKSLLSLFVCIPFLFHAQSNSDKEEAQKLGIEAISLIDKGEIEQAMDLLARAEKLDPENINYPYESAYGYYVLKDYAKANKILSGLIKREDATSPVYQLLGNTYDLLDDREKAMETYQKGLEKFPNSGNLYLEMGVIHLSSERLNEALNYFERGIYFDPGFPSNYYWAARFYLGSEEEVWGMLYGEIFMNLERGSKRTAEMSHLLYITYKSQIQFEDNQASVSFSKNSTISVGKDGEMKMPFPLMAYEPTLMLSLTGEEEINLASLHAIRSNFIRLYFEGSQKVDYPNVLFDYHKKLVDLGHFEAYNYWLLMKGDEEAFSIWQKAHEAAFDAFLDWYMKNPLKLDANHRFHSSFY